MRIRPSILAVWHDSNGNNPWQPTFSHNIPDCNNTNNTTKKAFHEPSQHHIPNWTNTILIFGWSTVTSTPSFLFIFFASTRADTAKRVCIVVIFFKTNSL
jgi:hypothetical protein